MDKHNNDRSSPNEESEVSGGTKQLDLKDIELPKPPQDDNDQNQEQLSQNKDESNLPTEQMNISQLKVNVGEDKSYYEEYDEEEEPKSPHEEKKKNSDGENDDNGAISKDQLKLPLEKLKNAFNDNQKKVKMQTKEIKKKTDEMITTIEQKLIIFKKCMYACIIISGIIGVVCFFYIIIFGSRNMVSNLGIGIVSVVIAYCGSLLFVLIKANTAINSYMTEALQKLRIAILVLYGVGWALIGLGIATIPYKSNIGGYMSGDNSVEKEFYQFLCCLLAFVEGVPIGVCLTIIVLKIKNLLEMMVELNKLNLALNPPKNAEDK